MRDDSRAVRRHARSCGTECCLTRGSAVRRNKARCRAIVRKHKPMWRKEEYCSSLRWERRGRCFFRDLRSATARRLSEWCTQGLPRASGVSPQIHPRRHPTFFPTPIFIASHGRPQSQLAYLLLVQVNSTTACDRDIAQIMNRYHRRLHICGTTTLLSRSTAVLKPTAKRIGKHTW